MSEPTRDLITGETEPPVVTWTIERDKDLGIVLVAYYKMNRYIVAEVTSDGLFLYNTLPSCIKQNAVGEILIIDSDCKLMNGEEDD